MEMLKELVGDMKIQVIRGGPLKNVREKTHTATQQFSCQEYQRLSNERIEIMTSNILDFLGKLINCM